MNTRNEAIQIFNAAVAAVMPEHLIPHHIFLQNNRLHLFDKEYNLDSLPDIYVIGAGKASAAMAAAIEKQVGSYITAGLVVTKYDHSITLNKIKCIEAAHPVPDENSITATLETLRLLSTVKDNDIVICLLSGGASALWADLPPGITLPAVQELFSLLLKSGAQIKEVNAVRKHLSCIKGGQLLRHAPGADWFSFIISDVPGDLLEAIASGPTVADASTFNDVKTILDRYVLTDRAPESVINHIQAGIKGLVKETVKENDLLFKRAHCRIIGSNRIALEAAAVQAELMGFYIPFIDIDLTGDAATIGRELMRTCSQYADKVPACFLFGGETTVQVKGAGKGGRNQHMALSAACVMFETGSKVLAGEVIILCAGTDGTDGPTDAAGAIADGDVVALAKAWGLDPARYLVENDAYHFFEQAGGLFKPGPTQTNVMDLVVVLIVPGDQIFPGI